MIEVIRIERCWAIGHIDIDWHTSKNYFVVYWNDR